MKLYILSNEIVNSEDPTFRIPLSEEGKNNSENKITKILSELEINLIYCSPFIRTLQTILQFKKKKNF